MCVATDGKKAKKGNKNTKTEIEDLNVKKEEEKEEEKEDEGGDPPADCELGGGKKFDDFDPGHGTGGSQAVMVS